MNSSLIQRITEKQASQTARDMQHWRRAKQVATRVDLPKRDLLDDLVNDLLYDTHLSSQMELRRDRSLAKPYTILKADGSTDEETTALLSQSGAFSMLMQIALETPLFGHSLVEILPAPEGLFTANLLPRRHVVPKLGWILFDLSDSKGYDYRSDPGYGKTLIEMGDPNDLGILFDCAPATIYKRYAMASWSEFCEIYGIPPRVLKINTDDSEAMQRAADMMQRMGSANWAIVDKDEDLSFAAGVSDNGNIFQKLIYAAKEDVSLKICGATLGQDTQYGNRSKEESSLELLEAKCSSDRRMLERIMTSTVLPALARQGFIPEGLRFAYPQEEDKEALWTRTVSLLPYYNVDEEWIRNTFGVEITDAKSQLPFGGQLAMRQQAPNRQELTANAEDPFFG
ncbi:DUF935 family protein [uncultured Porphyromonas sp.]|jgi:phage gp29-like protein|uniref:phage portal protein family protein n=1 Tax=uncultured Porphyromonas sp. TaxID=159274 RepID=UPI0020678F72|nr:DUF935 family protein [uncultured Porphyromonas sp.]DAZ27399.1 MAG TPA: portal [Caudoviricetes sp.]